MAKVILNIKTDTQVKEDAKLLAKEIGVPLSVIVNALLKQFIREREVVLSLKLEPSDSTKVLINELEEDIKGDKNLSTAFDNAKDALSYLKK